jgi:hypothetical protein
LKPFHVSAHALSALVLIVSSTFCWSDPTIAGSQGKASAPLCPAHYKLGNNKDAADCICYDSKAKKTVDNSNCLVVDGKKINPNSNLCGLVLQPVMKLRVIIPRIVAPARTRTGTGL